MEEAKIPTFTFSFITNHCSNSIFIFILEMSFQFIFKVTVIFPTFFQ